MPKEGIRCDDCGELSHDPDWCDHCGAALKGAGKDSDDDWLSTGETLKVDVDGVEKALHIEEAIEDFATRKVFTASLEGESADLYFVEQFEDDGRTQGAIPEGVAHLFRRPFHSEKRGESFVEVYTDVGGMTIEDLVEIANGQLAYAQIKDVFESVANSVSECHGKDFLVLAIAPWTVRVDGISPQFKAADTTPEGSVDVDIAPVSDNVEAETGELDRESAIEDEASEGLENETEAVDVYDDEVDLPEDAEASTDIDESDDDEASHVDGEELEAIADQLEDAEDEAFSAWDVFDEGDDTGIDVLGDTGILPMSHFVAEAQDLTSVFEGLDRVYPLGENPEEVPVIMGFSPPELLGRVRADISEACDVFGLGMLLYYLIAGRMPPASVYTRYAPALPVRNFRPGFPPGLQPVISRATRPNPDERYPSVQAMVDAFFKACSCMEKRASHVGKEPAETPRFRLAVDTHVGIAKGRRNPTNQDSVFGHSSDDGRFALVVIADGVSTASYGTGDLASHSLTERASEAWEELLPAYLMDETIDEITAISNILNDANQDIVDYVNAHHSPFVGNPHEVMGTTALVAILRDGVVTLAALGDSRCYIQNSQGLEQVTADHNLWSLSVLDGVSADSALAMPHGDALARCLGTFAIREGRLDSVPPEPDFFKFSLTRGDTLLLTTDGLVDFAGPNPQAAEENIQAVLVAEPDPALACLELILLGNRGGGGDNIGVGIAQFF